MFDRQTLGLRERQLAIRLRNAELRAEIAQDLRPLQPALSLASTGWGLWRQWRAWERSPAARLSTHLLSLAGVLLAGRARRRWMPWLRLLRRSLGLWQLWRERS